MDMAAGIRIGLSTGFDLGALRNFVKCDERGRGILTRGSGILKRVVNLQIRVGGNNRQVTIGSFLAEKIDFGGDFLGICVKVCIKL